MKLSDQERSHVRKLTAEFEARTGVQVLAVVAGKSDTYPEVPWKAFSLGAALATLVLIAAASLGFAGVSLSPLPFAMAILCTGMVWALAGIFLRPVARSFLVRERAEEETRQLARSLFLERGLSRTRSRKAVLLLVSQLERRSSLVADTGVVDRLPSAELDGVAAAMDAALVRGRPSVALAAGLSALEELLLQHGFAAEGAGNEIAGEYLETEGPNP